MMYNPSQEDWYYPPTDWNPEEDFAFAPANETDPEPSATPELPELVTEICDQHDISHDDAYELQRELSHEEFAAMVRAYAHPSWSDRLIADLAASRIVPKDAIREGIRSCRDHHTLALDQLAQHETVTGSNGERAACGKGCDLRDSENPTGVHLGLTKEHYPVDLYPRRTAPGAKYQRGYQVKPATPLVKENGDSAKYLSNGHQHTEIGIPTRSLEILDNNPKATVLITEGARKALAVAPSAAAEGGAVVYLAGVENWRDSDNEDSEPQLCASLRQLVTHGRTFIIGYDSDAMTKKEVRRAAKALRKAILDQAKARSYKVKVLYSIPPDLGDGKTGWDDAVAYGYYWDDIVANATTSFPGVDMLGIRGMPDVRRAREVDIMDTKAIAEFDWTPWGGKDRWKYIQPTEADVARACADLLAADYRVAKVGTSTSRSRTIYQWTGHGWDNKCALTELEQDVDRFLNVLPYLVDLANPPELTKEVPVKDASGKPMKDASGEPITQTVDIEDAADLERVSKHFYPFTKERTRVAVRTMAMRSPSLTINSRDMDSDVSRDLIPFMNGVWDCKEDGFREWEREDLISWSLPWTYKEGATHPLLEPVLYTLGDEDQRDWLQVRLGQAVTGHYPTDDRAIILYGKPKAGKTQLAVILHRALGGEAGAGMLAPMPLEAISGEGNNKVFAEAFLKGKRIPYVDELGENCVWDVEKWKNFMSLAPMSGRAPGETFEDAGWLPSYSPIFATNHLPRFRGESQGDDGVWRRAWIVPMPRTYVIGKPGPDETEADPHLMAKLAADWDGFMTAFWAWIIEGTSRWTNGGLEAYAPPFSVMAATEDWKFASDNYREWMNEHLVFDRHLWEEGQAKAKKADPSYEIKPFPDVKAGTDDFTFTTLRDLHESYTAYLGKGKTPPRLERFGKELAASVTLQANGCLSARAYRSDGTKPSGYWGVRLREARDARVYNDIY
ncbi:MAG: DUF3854 domain-containing protein [Dermatophilaceae bacterium]